MRNALVLAALLVAACSSGAVPAPCAERGLACGPLALPGMAPIDCGACPSGASCVDGQCACQPSTCAEQGRHCGALPDGCGKDLDCGACDAPETCGGAGTPGACGCVPLGPAACATAPVGCGFVPDGCGGFVDCGACPAGLNCGGGGPNRCGEDVCAPRTCADYATAACGKLTDGCGGLITCGPGCADGERCTGANTCVCAPETDAEFCARTGAECGAATGVDNCGIARSVASCGGCAAPESCNGAGMANRCGCTPRSVQSCAAQGTTPQQCGSTADECGGFLDCGACTQGTCGGGGPGRCGAGSCVPKTCADYPQVECGQVTDGCGKLIPCGAGCGPGSQCSASNTCVCTPETDEAFCARLGKNCGVVSGTDNCGAARSVASCGTCTFPQTCGDNGAGPAKVCGCAACVGCTPASAQCRPNTNMLGATCGNCGAETSLCLPSCQYAAPQCKVNGSCAPPADVVGQLRRSCYCIACSLPDVDDAHQARCAYLRWAFFPWGQRMTRSFFDGTVATVSQAARTRGMVAEFGIPEYLASPTPTVACPADRLHHVEIDPTKVAAWNAILVAHRPTGSIAPYSPSGTDLSFNYDNLWIPGPNPNWVYGVCAGIPSLGSDEGWRYHLYVALAALDAGVGGLYLSQLDLRQAPLGHVQAFFDATRAYSEQLHPGVHLVIGSESADHIVDGLPGQLDYVKNLADFDVARAPAPDGLSWPSVLDSDGLDTFSCYAPNLLEEPAYAGTDPRGSVCASPVVRTGSLCIGDSDRPAVRTYAFDGDYPWMNPNFRAVHERSVPVMLELDGFQQCAYKTPRYVNAMVSDGVLPIFYKPNLCADYDQTTCLASVRNGVPSTTAFLSQPADRRRAFLTYAAQAAQLLTEETGVPHYFPQLIRVDQNLAVVAKSTSQIAGATVAEQNQAGFVRYCPSTLNDPGLPFSPDYTYSARECGDLDAVTAAIASASTAIDVAAQGFVRHAYRRLFAREPDAAGLAYWAGTIVGAADREAAAWNVLSTFVGSTTESIASVDAATFTTRLHQAFLGRVPSAAELGTRSVQPRGTQVGDLLASWEGRRHLRALGLRTAKLNHGAFVSGLFRMLARRQPNITLADIAPYAEQLFRGLTTPAALTQAFVASTESENTWNTACAASPTMCNGWFVTEAYRAIYHREPDPGGYTYWKGQLDAAQISRQGLVNVLIAQPEFGARLTRIGL